MNAIILCAGHGTRLRPLTYYLSKAMVPVAGVPVIEHIIVRLRDHGFDEQIIALSWMADQVTHYLGDGSRLGVQIQYSINTEPSGTAGEVHNLRELLEGEEHILVHYGDILTNLDVRGLADEHLERQPTATLGFVTGIAFHAGVAEVADDGTVLSFVEKPPIEKPTNAAVFALSRRALDYCGPGRDFSRDVFPELIAAGEVVRGFVDREAWWIDVGRLSDLERANEFLGGGH
ncbi:MAG: nucleotidyltransferase family protein [Armatimonadota bacterium]|nr:nucleotidyltransferase family protein [Armatimonadota bacterium]